MVFNYDECEWKEQQTTNNGQPYGRRLTTKNANYATKLKEIISTRSKRQKTNAPQHRTDEQQQQQQESTSQNHQLNKTINLNS